VELGTGRSLERHLAGRRVAALRCLQRALPARQGEVAVMSGDVRFLRVANVLWRAGYGTFCALVLLFLIAPVIIVVPLSFNAEPFFTVTSGMLHLDPEAYSLRWYRNILDNPQWPQALRNSAFIAFMAVIPATVLGTA